MKSIKKMTAIMVLAAMATLSAPQANAGIMLGDAARSTCREGIMLGDRASGTCRSGIMLGDLAVIGASQYFGIMLGD